MPKDFPDHHDAELVIRLYELRREPTMRLSRDAIAEQFWPKSYEEVLAVTKSDHPLNAAYRQTSTYWEMVYGMAKHGIIHSEFLMETSGEGLVLYAKVQPYLEQLRKDASPRSFLNAEWIATHSELGKAVFERQRARVAKQREAK